MVLPNFAKMTKAGKDWEGAIELLKTSRMRAPARVEAMPLVRDSFLTALREAGLARKDVDSWTLVFTEAFVNGVRHGAREHPEAGIGIEWSLGRGQVILKIEDPGPGLPPERSGASALPEDPLEECGRGLFLIESICDATEHWTAPGGHCFWMVRNHADFDPAAAEDALLGQTMEELSSSYESLSAFYQLGEALIHSDQVTEFLEKGVRDLMKLVEMDRISLTWEPVVDPSLFSEIESISFREKADGVSEGRERVLQGGQSFVFETGGEVLGDPLFGGLSSGACLPIQAGGNIMGTLNVGRSRAKATFTAKDLSTLRTYADLFGISLAHTHNTMARTREQKTLRELEIASELQNNLVPTAAPDPVKEWDLFLRRMSARSVSGDYAEGVILPDGRLFLVIADVMGKGVSAAFLAGMLRTAIRLLVGETPVPLPDLARRLNVILCQLIGDLTLFTTAGLAMISRDRGEVEILNAGHCPILVSLAGEWVSVKPSGPPLGLFPEQVYLRECYSLAPGDWLLMVTDGIFEWQTESKEIWGWKRFLQQVRADIKNGGSNLWGNVQYLRNKAGLSDQLEDDQTLVYWKRNQ